ncbi:galaxin-like isoform X2 [Mizuhopecten yessoensis]|uniref:galaxin-like isoform X2 n=1 Tax=Mizuhopecten yessoensis TaxID=6573 RepID=UPI000B45B502|nr:galaxin-like isoform X2 [Mizuhopecten yessoensis]
MRMSVGLTHFCDKTNYNLDEQICCDSKLSDRKQDGQIIQCCNASGETYKNESEICCGSVYNKTVFENQNLSCCNGTRYQKGKEMCLGGEIKVRMSVGLTHFCDKTNYNLDEQICCDSKLSDRKQDGQIIQCCNASGKTYKNASEICCGNVYDKTVFENHNLSCCNGTLYQKGKEMCLGGEKIAVDGNRPGFRDDTRIDMIERQLQKIDEVQKTLHSLTGSVNLLKNEIYSVKIICRWLSYIGSLEYHKRIARKN